VAVAFVGVAVGGGLRAAFGVLLVPVADSFGWGRGIPAAAFAVTALTGVVVAAPMGALFDRWGSRVVFAGAAGLTTLGLLIAAATSEPWHFYLGVGVLAGIGYATFQPIAQSTMITRWFPTGRGLATAVAASGVGLGILALAPLIQ
jgi:MFS family permease